MHNFIRTTWNNKNLIFCLSSPVAPGSDCYFFNTLAFLVFLIHDGLCFALPLALFLAVYFESYSALFSSLTGVLGSFSLFVLHPTHGWSETFLKLHCQLILTICITTFFPDLSSLVKIRVSELYDSSPEIVDNSYWYQEFLFSSIELLLLLFHNFF